MEAVGAAEAFALKVPVYAGGHCRCVAAVEPHTTLVAGDGFLVLEALVAGSHVHGGHVVLLVIILLTYPLSINKFVF